MHPHARVEEMVTIRIEAGDIVKALVIIALLLSPFLLGWFLWGLLVPVGFWQSIASLLVIGGACLFEGLIAWFVAIAIIVA